MNKELEKAIYRLKLHKEGASLENGTCVVNVEDLETVLSYIDNSVSKNIIEDKIKRLENEQTKVKKHKLIYSREEVFRFQIYTLEELLEE